MIKLHEKKFAGGTKNSIEPAILLAAEELAIGPATFCSRDSNSRYNVFTFSFYVTK